MFFLALLTTIPGWLLTGGLMFLIVRQVRLIRKASSSLPLDPAVIELRRLLEELDRRLRRIDLERAADETLHQFAARLRIATSSHPDLRHAAEWYLRYAAMRYGQSPGPEIHESLRAELQSVCERLSVRRTAT